ncbi:hypothetical protein Leryth_002627 [Lithospermum erythrorhizon]|nr:hypothetical protein Leryth_002627 [Lithospermum erythrorhizon]
MLSALPVMLPNDGLFGNNTFQDFDSLWDYQESLFTFPPPNEPVESFLQFNDPFAPSVQTPEPEPVVSNSGSENSNHVLKNNNISPLNETIILNHASPDSGSDELNHLSRGTCIVEDRKERRKVSNRESARRSRVRKQRHLENLRNKVTGLLMGNRELMNRLRSVTHHYQVARSENQRLRSESNVLRQRLWDIRQVLLVRELQHQLPVTNNLTPSWPCNNNNNNVIITSIEGHQQTMP